MGCRNPYEARPEQDVKHLQPWVGGMMNILNKHTISLQIVSNLQPPFILGGLML